MISEFKGRPSHSKDAEKSRIFEIKSRPRKDLLLLNKRTKDLLGRRIRNKFSSTESMTTSSSGGSMESIKSSTSEGNRSTSSSESRQSASLSSHSSDSGGKTINISHFTFIVFSKLCFGILYRFLVNQICDFMHIYRV